MKTVIAGSRTVTNYDILLEAVAESGISITSVVCGLARGADALGKRYAKEHDIPCYEVPADWARYGRGAGFIRNVEMAEECEAGIVLWDGESRGARHMLTQLIKFKRPYYLKEVKL